MSDGMLIICGQREFGRNLLTIISSAIAGSHSLTGSGAEARRRLSLNEFAAVLIAGKLPDEPGLDLALDLAQDGILNLIYITDRNELLDAHEALDGTGVTILSTPLTQNSLTQAIRLVMRVSEGGGTFEKAKLMLVQQKNWTEPQAHRYIQKLSMDKRMPRDLAAHLVIKALEREINTSE